MMLKSIGEKNMDGSMSTSEIRNDFGNGIKAVSDIRKGKWTSTIKYGDTYNLNGIIETASFENGILTLGINDFRRHLVYQYNEYGECTINTVSKVLKADHPMGLYIKPADKSCILVKHKAVGKILPIVDDIIEQDKIISFSIGSVSEQFIIYADLGDTDSKVLVNTLYKISLDMNTRILCVEDLVNNKIISSEKLL